MGFSSVVSTVFRSGSELNMSGSKQKDYRLEGTRSIFSMGGLAIPQLTTTPYPTSFTYTISLRLSIALIISNNQYILIVPMLVCKLTLMLGLLLCCAGQVSEQVSWPQNILIKSGENKILLLSETGLKTLTYGQSFFQSFTSVPTVGLGITNLQVDKTSPSAISVGFSVTIISVSMTSFVSNLTVNLGTMVTLLTYMYIGVQNVNLFTFIYPVQQSIVSPSPCATLTLPTNNSFTLSNSNIFVAFPTGFTMSTNGNYSLQTYAQLTSSTTIQLSACSNATLLAIGAMVIAVDRTALQSTFLMFLDLGVYTAWNGGTSSSNTFIPPISGYNYYNSVAGFTSFVASDSATLSLLTTSNSISTTTSYSSAAVTLIAWRFRKCNTLTYYALQFQRCYGSCPTSYTANSYFNICSACDVGCATCLMLNSTTTYCTICPPLSFRTLSASGKCLCDSSYFDAGFQVCSSCAYVCTTCVTASIFCLSCDITRVLTNNSCPCKSRMYDNGTATCLACTYSCSSCRGTPTNCTGCNSAAQRVLNSLTSECLCGSGFKENATASVEQCVAAFVCLSSCVTCVTNSTTCTSCSAAANRVLFGSSCVCIRGFQEQSGVCSQLCGDGIRTNLACDDGNALSGDGCSSACSIELGFTCDTTNKDAPSICIHNAGYSLTVDNINRPSFDNFFTATLQIDPPPPATTSLSITNFPSSTLLISSFTCAGPANLYTVTFQFFSDLSALENVNIELSPIQQKATVALVTQNKLLLKVYSTSSRNIHTAELIFLIAYLASLWIGTVAVWIVMDLRLLSAVTEMFLYTAVVYVGYRGMGQLGIFYQPLSLLQHCLGYNLSLEPSVLGVLNTGLSLNLLPLIFYLLVLVIGKRNPDLFTIKTKRMILFDCSYAWMVLNGFLVVVGLSSAISSGVGSNLAIAGIAFGVLYLGFLGWLSYWFFFRTSNEDESHPKLECTKANLFRPAFLPLYYAGMLAASLVYLAIGGPLNCLLFLAGLIALGFCLAFMNLYVNKARSLLNICSLVLVFTCMLLFGEVDAAEWTGAVVVALMVLQLGLNILFMYLEGKKAMVIEIESELVSNTNRSFKQDLQRQSAARPKDRFSIYNKYEAKRESDMGQEKFQTAMKSFNEWGSPNPNMSSTLPPPDPLLSTVYHRNPQWEISVQSPSVGEPNQTEPEPNQKEQEEEEEEEEKFNSPQSLRQDEKRNSKIQFEKESELFDGSVDVPQELKEGINDEMRQFPGENIQRQLLEDSHKEPEAFKKEDGEEE